ncbi:anaphase-promoting complex subunit Cut9 [Dimargaris verticillata]|uniref:Anaphase-promoting complex subunit Cut9 n=1 Tax=Dimargaris verticillata TaxID=2761393 RepID=A0A9W8B089_9FUNG|nr:anaphase-promoting complex subunit Cut9 [Dimargaris verticillata]
MQLPTDRPDRPPRPRGPTTDARLPGHPAASPQVMLLNTPNSAISPAFGFSPLALPTTNMSPASSLATTPRASGFRRFPSASRPSLGPHRTSFGGISMISSPYADPPFPFGASASRASFSDVFPSHTPSTIHSRGGQFSTSATPILPHRVGSSITIRPSMALFANARVPAIHPERPSLDIATATTTNAEPEPRQHSVPLPAELEPTINRLRAWRRFAMDGLMWDTSVYWGEKVLSMTQEVQDLYALCYIHLAAGHIHRAEYLLMAHPKYTTYTQASWACRYLAALAEIQLGKYAEALWVLGEQPHIVPGMRTAGTSSTSASATRLSKAAKDSRTSIGGSVERRASNRPTGQRRSLQDQFSHKSRWSQGPAQLSWGMDTPVATHSGNHGSMAPPTPNPMVPAQPNATPLANLDIIPRMTTLPDVLSPHDTPTKPTLGPNAALFPTHSTTFSDNGQAQRPLSAGTTVHSPLSLDARMVTFASASEYPRTDSNASHTLTSSTAPEDTFEDPADGGLRFNAAVNYLRGVAYLKQQSHLRARHCLKEAVSQDVRCIEAFQLMLDHQLLTPAGLHQFVQALPFADQLGNFDGELVRDLYLTKLDTAPTDATPNPCYSANTSTTTVSSDATPLRSSFDKAVECLATRYRLHENPDLWAAAAKRAYAQGQVHDCFALTSAVLNSDPYHLPTLPHHIACLYTLRMKHQLFYLAHDLVDYFYLHMYSGSNTTIASTMAPANLAQRFASGATNPPDGTGNSASATPFPTRGQFAEPLPLWGHGATESVAASATLPSAAGATAWQAGNPHMTNSLAAKEAPHPVPWFAVGCYYLLTGKYPESRFYFSKACALDPRFGPAWVGFAHAFAADGEHEPAITAYATASRLFPGSHFVPLFMGMQYLQMGSLPLATSSLLTAVRSLVGSKPLPVELDASVATGAKSVSTNPPNTTTTVDQLLHSVSLARPIIQATAHPQVLNEIGVLAYHQAKYDIAVECLRRAEALLQQPDPTLRRAVEVLVNPRTSPQSSSSAPPHTHDKPAMNAVGNGSLFTVHGSLAPAQASGLETVWLNLAHVYRQRGEYEVAVNYLQRVRALAPTNAEVQLTLGMIHHIRGDLDPAIVLYHQALALDPANPVAQDLLTMALDHSVAQEGLPLFLDVGPADAQAYIPPLAAKEPSSGVQTLRPLKSVTSTGTNNRPSLAPDSDTEMDLEDGL